MTKKPRIITAINLLHPNNAHLRKSDEEIQRNRAEHQVKIERQRLAAALRKQAKLDAIGSSNP